MKKMIFTLFALLAMTTTANAMSYEQARNEALFLTDKMAYELNLTDAQYEAAYEINLDYLMGVTSPSDVYGPYWERRNLDLSYILYSWQWDLFRAATYFFRPLVWEAGYWHFSIYRYYPHRDLFYFGRPHFYATYRGGHSWHHNGGHSYYHGRSDHFRPDMPNNRHHSGMRDSYDRGNYRNSHNNSSTRVTAGNGGFGNHRGNNGGSENRPGNNGNNENRPGNNGGIENRRGVNNGGTTTTPRTNSDNRSFGSGSSARPTGNGNSSRPTGSSSTMERSTRTIGSGSSRTIERVNTPVRSSETMRSNSSSGTVRSSSTPSRSSSGTVHSSAPSRSSSSGSMRSSTPSRSSSSPSRSGGGSSSNRNGHFGGRR